MEISTEFVSQKDFDDTNKLHVLADERFRNRKYLGGLAPELILWMRRLLPALYVPSANSSSNGPARNAPGCWRSSWSCAR